MNLQKVFRAVPGMKYRLSKCYSIILLLIFKSLRFSWGGEGGS